jgi:hypothetical protein
VQGSLGLMAFGNIAHVQQYRRPASVFDAARANFHRRDATFRRQAFAFNLRPLAAGHFLKILTRPIPAGLGNQIRHDVLPQ